MALALVMSFDVDGHFLYRERSLLRLTLHGNVARKSGSSLSTACLDGLLHLSAGEAFITFPDSGGLCRIGLDKFNSHVIALLCQINERKTSDLTTLEHNFSTRSSHDECCITLVAAVADLWKLPFQGTKGHNTGHRIVVQPCGDLRDLFWVFLWPALGHLYV